MLYHLLMMFQSNSCFVGKNLSHVSTQCRFEKFLSKICPKLDQCVQKWNIRNKTSWKCNEHFKYKLKERKPFIFLMILLVFCTACKLKKHLSTSGLGTRINTCFYTIGKDHLLKACKFKGIGCFTLCSITLLCCTLLGSLKNRLLPIY